MPDSSRAPQPQPVFDQDAEHAEADGKTHMDKLRDAERGAQRGVDLHLVPGKVDIRPHVHVPGDPELPRAYRRERGQGRIDIVEGHGCLIGVVARGDIVQHEVSDRDLAEFAETVNHLFDQLNDLFEREVKLEAALLFFLRL